MFGKIMLISKNYAFVVVNNANSDDLLNFNVVFEDSNKRILGEIEEIDNGVAKIAFLGEYHDGKFYSGCGTSW